MASAWIVTDIEGHIETVSSAARQLFREASLTRGADLVEQLALPRRAAERDIETALIGWPAGRSLRIDGFGLSLCTLCYRITLRVPQHGSGLFWEFARHPSPSTLFA